MTRPSASIGRHDSFSLGVRRVAGDWRLVLCLCFVLIAPVRG
jgi:hypothetical protein